MIKSFQTKILVRALGEDGVKSIYQQYHESQHKSRTLKEPSEKDRRIVSLVRKNKSISQTARELAISPHKVYGAISRVSAYK